MDKERLVSMAQNRWKMIHSAAVGVLAVSLTAGGYLVGVTQIGSKPDDNQALHEQISSLTSKVGSLEDNFREQKDLVEALLAMAAAETEKSAELLDALSKLNAFEPEPVELEVVEEAPEQESEPQLIPYTIQHNDTLWSIAKRFTGEPRSGFIEAVMKFNRISDPTKPKPDAVIYIPLERK